MIKKILWILVLCLSVSCTFAFDIPANDGYVTDVAGVLSQQQKQNLDNQIFGFVKETSAQLGVLIIPTTEWEDIAMLATDVGNKRGVGEKDYNNGLVMVIAIDDRKWFIAVWYGLEGTIPDAIAKRIWEAQFPDNFRAGDYNAWIQAAVNDIYSYIKNDPTVVHAYESSTSFSIDDINPEFLFFLIIAFAWLIGKYITSPDPTDPKKRKMTKVGWMKFWLIWAVITGVLYAILGTIIGAILLSYAALWILTLFTVLWFGSWGIFIGWGRGGSFGGGGSSFGWFGGGSFGGGGWGGSR